MATIDYTTASAALADLENQITNAVKAMRQAKAMATTAKATLAGLPASSEAMRTWIDQQAGLDETDVALQAMLARKDKLVADFIARNSVAASMVTALNSFDP
jgi:multidrug resistance efflux pump